MWPKLLESVTERLVSGIPDKIKFIIAPSPVSVPGPAPETLLITTHVTHEAFQTSILEILNKRWRTLDLISMMKEFSRSSYEKAKFMFIRDPSVVQITDRLSSLPRFKKEEDLTD